MQARYPPGQTFHFLSRIETCITGHLTNNTFLQDDLLPVQISHYGLENFWGAVFMFALEFAATEPVLSRGTRCPCRKLLSGPEPLSMVLPYSVQRRPTPNTVFGTSTRSIDKLRIY